MEAVFGCLTSSGCLENGVHQVASPKNSDIFLSQKTGSPRTDPLQSSYNLYDHSQELQKDGSRIASKYFFCRGCKIPVEKDMLHKCGTSVTSSQSWLLAALAGAFHELQGEPSHIISRSTDPKTAADDWINNCLESMLTLLARGESFSHGFDSDGEPITSPVTTLKQSSVWNKMTSSSFCQNTKEYTSSAQSKASPVLFMTNQT